MTKKRTQLSNQKDFSELSEQERLEQAERIYVKYDRADKLFNMIDSCRIHSKKAKDPDCLLITGASGAGKTRLCERYVKDFPRRRVEKQTEDGIKRVTIVPVLFVTCPTKATEKSLAEILLRELGDSEAHKGTLTTQTLRFCSLAKECEVELIIIDEFQHLWDRDGEVIRRNVANYVKEIIIRTGKPMILVGMPSSKEILDDNPQLNRRFKRASLDPLMWDPTPQKGSEKPVSEFKAFLSLLDDGLPLKRSNLADETIAKAFHDATGGVVDRIMRIIHMATAIALEDGLEKLDMKILSEAYEIEFRPESPEDNPFGPCFTAPRNPFTNEGSKEHAVSRRVKPKAPKRPSANSVLRRR
jgi:GTPase SAR1 family protein